MHWIRNGRATMGSAYADCDQDGFVDLVVTAWNEGPRLYRNTALTLRLQGAGVHVSRDAVGARAYLERDDGLRLMQELRLGSSLGPGNESALRFGLYTEPLVISYAPAAE